MSVGTVLLPVFVYVALIYGFLGTLIASRRAAARRSRPPGAVAAGGWEATARQVGASYSNQFELPVLFFALVALVLATHGGDAVFVTLEWLFIAARSIHAAVHMTVNVVPLRAAAFAASAAILGVAWIRFAIVILAG